MKNISHNISKTIDPVTVEILEIIDKAARELDVPYFLVGAKARDFLLHYAYGINVQRATEDYDIELNGTGVIKFKPLRLGFTHFFILL